MRCGLAGVFVVVTLAGATDVTAQTDETRPDPMAALRDLMHAPQYLEAMKAGDEAARQEDWEEAERLYGEAHRHAQSAFIMGEFGTTTSTYDFGQGPFTIPLPKGAGKVTDVARKAARAADRAGHPHTALAWVERASLGSVYLAELEASARADGRREAADVYLASILRRRAEVAEQRSRRLESRRRKVRTSSVGFAVGLVLMFIAWAMWKWRRRRPRFVYYRSGRHARAVRSPPAFRASLLVSPVVGLLMRPPVRAVLFGCVAAGLATISILAMWWGTHDASPRPWVGSIVGWLFASASIVVAGDSLGRWPRRRPSPQPIDDLPRLGSPAKEFSERIAWFAANRRELMRDFGVTDVIGRTRRAPRVLEHLEVIGDPLAKSLLLAWFASELAREGAAVPAEWDSVVERSLSEDLRGWEEVLSPWVRTLDPDRVSAVLGNVSRKARVVVVDRERLALDDAHEEGAASNFAGWLEWAMVAGRRWTLKTWRERFLDSPWARRRCEAIVWGAFEAEDLRASFRIDADATLVDAGAEAVESDALGGLHIGVAHPVELGSTAVREWSEHLADFEVFAVIDQLDRPIPPDFGPTRTHIDLPGQSPPAFRQRVDDHVEQCRPFGVTARMERPPHRPSVTRVRFVRGYPFPVSDGELLPLCLVPPIAISELAWSVGVTSLIQPSRL